MTPCRQEKLSFQGIEGKRVEGRFDGGKLSTEGGLLLIREVLDGQRFFSRLSKCFTDTRCQDAVTHPVERLVRQRVYGLLAGTRFEKAEPASIRTRLIKLAVKVTVSARRVYFSFASACPLQDIFLKATRQHG